MNNKFLKMAFAGLVLSVSGFANASFISYTAGPGLGLNITDDGFDGTLGSMTQSSINVGVEGVLSSLVIEVSLSHTWVGDLVMRLQGPDSTFITLLSRPGLVGGDDGSICCGNSDDAFFSGPIIFDDMATTAAEDWSGLGGSFLPNDVLSTFTGTSIAGVWSLFIGDSVGSDLGVINSWSLNANFQPVPEPSTLAILGLGLMGLAARRFKKQA